MKYTQKLFFSAFILLAIILGMSFVSASLCKGSDGYYHDCDDFRYGRYNRYDNYNEYGRHVGHYEYRNTYKYDSDYKLKYKKESYFKDSEYKRKRTTWKKEKYNYPRKNYEKTRNYGYRSNKYWDFGKRDFDSGLKDKKYYKNLKKDDYKKYDYYYHRPGYNSKKKY
jgi:hypothetical protein